MSLLLEIIRQVLEYLGVPPEQLVQVWENYTSRRRFLCAITNRLQPLLYQGIEIRLPQVLERKDYGWTRSVVRIIGTLLPLEPCPRPCFQIVGADLVANQWHIAALVPALVSELLKHRRKDTICRPDIPSLAEAPFLMSDEVASYARFRYNLASSVEGLSFERPIEKSSSMILATGVSDDNRIAPSEDAIQKIAALEDELMQLRAQIASIVAMQETKSMHSCSETMCLLASPCAALPPPSSTSTPINDRFLQSTPAPPPPPPPPPPPIPSIKVNSAKSAIDLIKERKASHKQSPQNKEVPGIGSMDKLPSMMDVLKDLNSIKLRAVERSPGGTPLTKKDKRRSLNDPAAIIAHALKQKFSHRRGDDSFDKENRSREESPFSSPEMPVFGRHLLKPNGKRTQKEIPRKQVFSKPGPHI
ncbi:mitochondrial fission regulator 2 [Gastrophryne carolinensis]